MAMRNVTAFGLALALLGMGAATGATAAAIAAPGTEGARLIATGGEVTVTYLGSGAFFENRVFLDNGDDDYTNDRQILDNRSVAVGDKIALGAFEAGEELVLRLDVVNNETRFFTGPATRNLDGLAHARVQSGWRPDRTLVSFEDLYNGPLEFNDFSLAFTNATADRSAAEALGSGVAVCVVVALGALAGRRRGPA